MPSILTLLNFHVKPRVPGLNAVATNIANIRCMLSACELLCIAMQLCSHTARACQPVLRECIHRRGA